MEVLRTRFVDGARRARGVVVIIDVFRAFSLCAYAAALGARPLLVTADTQVARAFKARRPQALLAGEEGGWPIPGFDLGNSPTQLLQMVASGGSVRERPWLQRTSAGTQGVMVAGSARCLFVASLVNARATAAAVRALQPACVTLVAMGLAGREVAIEDEACAEAIAAHLAGQPWDGARAAHLLYTSARVRELLAGSFEPFPPSDVALCLAVDLFPFALKARRRGPLALIRPLVVQERHPRPRLLRPGRPSKSDAGPPQRPAPP